MKHVPLYVYEFLIDSTVGAINRAEVIPESYEKMQILYHLRKALAFSEKLYNKEMNDGDDK